MQALPDAEEWLRNNLFLAIGSMVISAPGKVLKGAVNTVHSVASKGFRGAGGLVNTTGVRVRGVIEEVEVVPCKCRTAAVMPYLRAVHVHVHVRGRYVAVNALCVLRTVWCCLTSVMMGHHVVHRAGGCVPCILVMLLGALSYVSTPPPPLTFLPTARPTIPPS